MSRKVKSLDRFNATRGSLRKLDYKEGLKVI